MVAAGLADDNADDKVDAEREGTAELTLRETPLATLVAEATDADDEPAESEMAALLEIASLLEMATLLGIAALEAAALSEPAAELC